VQELVAFSSKLFGRSLTEEERATCGALFGIPRVGKQRKFAPRRGFGPSTLTFWQRFMLSTGEEAPRPRLEPCAELVNRLTAACDCDFGNSSEEEKFLRVMKLRWYDAARTEKKNANQLEDFATLLSNWVAEQCTVRKAVLAAASDNLALLQTYVLLWRSFSCFTVEFSQFFALFDRKINKLYEKCPQVLCNFPRFSTWTLMARAWVRDVYMPLREALTAAFRELLLNARLARLRSACDAQSFLQEKALREFLPCVEDLTWNAFSVIFKDTLSDVDEQRELARYRQIAADDGATCFVDAGLGDSLLLRSFAQDVRWTRETFGAVSAHVIATHYLVCAPRFCRPSSELEAYISETERNVCAFQIESDSAVSKLQSQGCIELLPNKLIFFSFFSTPTESDVLALEPEKSASKETSCS
jgi:hypothetical protein